MPAGRPTKLTPEVLEDVRRLLPTALYLETVGDYLGIGRTSIHRWLKRGAKEKHRLERNSSAKPRKKEAIYLEFWNVYKRALAEGELYSIGVIRKASTTQVNAEGEVMQQGQWQAAAWQLERRFPDRWGRKDQLTMSRSTERELDAELARTLEEIAARRQAQSTGESPADPGPDASAE